jgi:membrane protease YdiL (CAAX protease family)
MNEVSSNKEFLAIFSILLIVFVVCLHYYLNRKKVLLGFMMRVTRFSFSQEAIEFVIEKLSGLLLFGVVPFIFFIIIFDQSPVKVGLTIGKSSNYWYLILLLPIIFGSLSFYSSKSKENWKISPQMRVKNWHLQHILLSASGWLAYLFGYEFMLRGILWFLCTDAFGFWPALAINIVIYSAIHIPKGFLLTIGTIPVGLIFCILTYITGSFFLAFITHASISVTNDCFSVYHNPEFKLILKKDKVNK